MASATVLAVLIEENTARNEDTTVSSFDVKISAAGADFDITRIHGNTTIRSVCINTMVYPVLLQNIEHNSSATKVRQTVEALTRMIVFYRHIRYTCSIAACDHRANHRWHSRNAEQSQ